MSKERPRVAVFSPYTLRRGSPDGVKDYIQTLRPALERKGIEVVLVGPSIKDKENNLADHALGLAVRVKMKGTSYQGTATFNIIRAKRIIKHIDPDIVEFHEPWANPSTVETVSLVLPKKEGGSKTPEIFHFHAHSEKLTLPQRTLVFAAHKTGLVKRVMGRVSERHAVSPDTRRFWSKVNKEPEGLYEVIPNPIDTELFSYNVLEKEKKREKLIICTTRHDERKGIDDLIFAAYHLVVNSDIRDLIVKITGEGQKTPELKNLVKRLDLSNFVKFVGTLSVEELAVLTAQADLLIAPSKGGEGFNRSIGNARAAGTLVVATRIPGQTFAYGPEEIFGKMCLPNNPRDLAARIKEFLALPDEEKDRRREIGRRYVEENFSTEVVAQKKVAAYERVIFEKH